MDPVRADCRALLRTHGPMSLRDLASRLSTKGHVIADDPDALDEHLFPFAEGEWVPCELADGRLADAEHLLDGLVLTTRLTAEGIEAGQPTISPDLAPLLEWRPGAGMPLAGGGTLTVELDDEGTWRVSGPPDWMPGTAGRLLVTRVEDGQLHVEAIGAEKLADDTDLVGRLADTYDRMREHRAGVEVEALVLDLRARHPRALTSPHRPLGELVAEAGLAVYGDWVVDPAEIDEDGVPTGNFPDDLEPATSLDALAVHLVQDHGMTEHQADEFVLLKVLTTGERLRRATDHEMTTTTGDRGRLVPVLAARDDRLQAAERAAFPGVVRRSTSMSNGSGFVAGQAAAEQASLEVSPHHVSAS